MTDPAPVRPSLDLTPFERWEAVTLDGEHVGFLHRVLDGTLLTTRMGFAPTPVQRRARPELPERYLAQSQVSFTADGTSWDWTSHEDSAGAQRVRIDRERAGLDADVLPSYAEYLLLAVAAADGPVVVAARLEESSPLQGGLRMPRAELRPGDAGDGDVSVTVVADGPGWAPTWCATARWSPRTGAAARRRRPWPGAPRRPRGWTSTWSPSRGCPSYDHAS